jgi:aminoacrylate hydrolase
MTDIKFWTRGRGPRVLLIQGVGVAGAGWAPQVDGLASDFELAWFDNRGIAGSPGTPGTLEEMAADALSVMDALGWDRAHLVGHSLGGVIAQQVAVLWPERVLSLSCLCTYARGRAAISLRPADMWLSLRTAVGTKTMRRKAFFQLVTDPAVPTSEEEIVRLEAAFGRNLADLPPNAPRQVMVLARSNLLHDLASISVPSLVVSATNDRVAPVGQGPILAKTLGAEFIELPGGHAVTVQSASVVNGLIRDFLS